MSKYVYIPILILNLVVGVAMLITGYSYLFNPNEHGFLALSGFFFPIFYILTFAFLFFWLLFKKTFALFSFAMLVAAYSPIHRYSPLLIRQVDEMKSLRFFSWNVHNFQTPNADAENTLDSIVDYLLLENADVICLQEAKLEGSVKDKFLDNWDNIECYNKEGGTSVACISRFPIIKVEPIEYESKGNCSVCFYIKTDRDTLRVVNNHFQSVGFDINDKEEFPSIVEGVFQDESKREDSKRILKCLLESMKKRAPQAEAVAKFVGENPKKTVVLGDFNDTPISYTHNCFDQIMTDCYAKRGKFLGFSYKQNSMYVRIDHAFCSEDLTVNRCWVDQNVEYSDHYPLGVTFVWKDL